MAIWQKWVKKTDFHSYEEFRDGYRLEVPADFQFARDVVDAWAEEEPDKTALLWCDDSGEERRFSFADISLLSKKAAGFLRQQGVCKGDRVLMLLRRRWEYWVLAVALHRMGATLIPASIQLTAKDLAYRVCAASVKMIIAVNDPFVVEQVEGAKPLCPSLALLTLVGGKRVGWADFSGCFEEAAVPEDWPDIAADDLLLMYFTSGTTGMPKAVAHDQLYPLGHIVTAKYMQNVSENGLHLTVSDSGWAKFGWGCLYGQWIMGSAVLGYDPLRFEPGRLIRVIREKQPTTLCVPPTIYRFMMKEGITREDFQSVRHCATAGEPLSPAVSEEFYAVTGLKIHEGFGQSEGPVLVCTWPFVEPRFGSMGKPNPAFPIDIVDGEGNSCEPGRSGEIVVKGLRGGRYPGLLRGILEDGKIVPCYDDTYHTKDIAYRDEDGYFWYVGRNDDVIKCSGYRIGPYEIESVLNTHPAVKECIVSGAPDPVRGQVVAADVVLNPGYSENEALTKELQQHVKRLTAPYKYPRVIRYVREIAKTTSGKIIRARA